LIDKIIKERCHRVFPTGQFVAQGGKLVDDQSQRLCPAATQPDVLIEGGEDPEELKASQFQIKLVPEIQQDGLAFALDFLPVNPRRCRAKHGAKTRIQGKGEDLVKVGIQKPPAVCLSCGNIFFPKEGNSRRRFRDIC
jgi:hypothetical protein